MYYFGVMISNLYVNYRRWLRKKKLRPYIVLSCVSIVLTALPYILFRSGEYTQLIDGLLIGLVLVPATVLFFLTSIVVKELFVERDEEWDEEL